MGYKAAHRLNTGTDKPSLGQDRHPQSCPNSSRIRSLLYHKTEASEHAKAAGCSAGGGQKRNLLSVSKIIRIVIISKR